MSVKNGFDQPEYDSEGRVITAEYDDFFLINTCKFNISLLIFLVSVGLLFTHDADVPNAGAGLKNLARRMQWDIDFRKYLKSLDDKKPIILCGDLNVSHQPVGMYNFVDYLRRGWL